MGTADRPSKTDEEEQRGKFDLASSHTGSVRSLAQFPLPRRLVLQARAECQNIGSYAAPSYNQKMKHSALPDPSGFGDLPKEEQILYVQALWDRITEKDSEIPILSSQLEIAEARLRSHRQAPEQAKCARQMLLEVSQAKL